IVLTLEVDEMLCLMSDVAAEVPSNNAMPCIRPDTTVFTSHLLYVGCNVLFYIVLLHGLGSTVHCILLHVLRHVSILDYCLPVSHLGLAYPVVTVNSVRCGLR
uniref:Uncharacterized protein n=1 Tax=Hucho hucho TaxID=62062 RepID=A0A4W5LV02_9TELE